MAKLFDLANAGIDHFRRPHWNQDEFLHLAGIEDARGVYVCDHTLSQDRTGDADPNQWDDWVPYEGPEKREIRGHTFSDGIFLGAYSLADILAGKVFDSEEAKAAMAAAIPKLMADRIMDIARGMVVAAARGQVPESAVADFIVDHLPESEKSAEGIAKLRAAITDTVGTMRGRITEGEKFIQGLPPGSFGPPMQA